MMRINAVITRIIRQFYRDKRTLALLIFAPLLVLTLMSYVFSDNEASIHIGVENESIEQMLSSLTDKNTVISMTQAVAEERFKEGTLDAYISKNDQGITMLINGSDSAISAEVIQKVQSTFKANKSTQDTTFEIDIAHYYGSEEMNTLDYLGPLLIGFFIFFFVFLISGVSFLRERTTGTLERLLATPIKRVEIVLGYLIGFGIFTIIQSAIISLYSIKVLQIYNAGDIGLILLITIIVALCALSLGMFVSAYANNELQVIQFIPIVIVPQVFFCGIFPLRGMAQPLRWLSRCMPMTYAAEALRDVMTCGATLADIRFSLIVLIMFTVVFGGLNVIALKKHRVW